MFSAEGKFLEVEVAFVLFVADHDMVVLQEGALLDFAFLGEGQHLGLGDDVAEVAYGDFVVGVEDEAVFGAQILDNTEFGADVILHLVVVAVEVVGGDVGDDGDIRPEVIAVVQLEAADFEDVVVVVASCHLICVAHSDIAAEPDVEAGLLQEVVDKGGGGRLAVRAGNADLAGFVVAACKLDFRDDFNSIVFYLPDDGG